MEGVGVGGERVTRTYHFLIWKANR